MFTHKIKIPENMFLRVAIPKHFKNREYKIADNTIYFNISVPAYIDENFFADFCILDSLKNNI